MDWNKVQMMAEQNTLFLLLKEQGLPNSLDEFKVLCDKAKKAADKAVGQEQKNKSNERLLFGL